MCFFSLFFYWYIYSFSLREAQFFLTAVSPSGVLEEARFYGIEGAVEILEPMVAGFGASERETAALTRRDVLRAILSTPTTQELRFQGVNLAGADLSRLDLRNINFKVSSALELLYIRKLQLTAHE